MDQTTAFKRALLEQFKTLARDSETALDGSQKTSEVLRGASPSLRVHLRLERVKRKQREIENFQKRLLEDLNG